MIPVGFIDFNTDDPTILAAYSLTSANDIGNGTIAGTGETFDPVLGFQSGGVGNVITYNSTLSSSLIPDHADFDTGFTIQFECDTEYLAALNNGTATYPFTWLRNGSSTAKYIRMQGGPGTEFVIYSRLDTSTTAPIIAITSVGKGRMFQVHLSFRKGFVDMFIDKCWLAAWVNDDPTGTTLFETLYFGGHPVLPYFGFIRNLQVVNRPLVLPISPRLQRVAFVGDSIMAQGNWESSTEQKFTGTDTSVSSANQEDAGCTPECFRYFAQKGINTRIRSYADTSDSVIETSTNDIMDQIDGTGAFDALEHKPTWLVLLGGFNDTTNVGGADFTDGANFEVAYQALLTQVWSVSPETRILCLSNHTRENHASFDGTTEQTATNNLNARIQEVVAANRQAYFADWFTYMGGHTEFVVTDFLSGDFHLSRQGGRKLGIFIAVSLSALI